MHHMKKIKARKDYVCAACSICIPVGVPYVRTAEICDGKWHHTKWHTECRMEFDKMLNRDGQNEAPADWTWDDKGVPQELEDKYVGLAFENILIER